MSFSDLKIKRTETTADTLTVEIMDGRVLSVPLAYYPTLLHATEAERKNCHPIGAGYGIEWPALDYHLSVEGLMQGLPGARLCEPQHAALQSDPEFHERLLSGEAAAGHRPALLLAPRRNSRSVWTAVASAPLSARTEIFRHFQSAARTTARLEPAHSKRFAPSFANLESRAH